MPAAPAPPLDCPPRPAPPGAQGIARVAADEAAWELVVTFWAVVPAGSPLLDPRAYALTGGARLFPRVTAVNRFDPPGAPAELAGRRLRLTLDGIGDFSPYTLRATAPGLDPFFAAHPVRFRRACDAPADCRPPAPGPPDDPGPAVAIDYLTKDYAGFRRALLDFIPTRLPGWTERNEADVGMMLAELFAATADGLSYTQDRVANEAYLDTASQRRSVAGHLALLGYTLDEGAAAFAWLCFETNEEAVTLAPAAGLRVTSRRFRDDDPVWVFEPHGTTVLRKAHNQMPAYDWREPNCCLPRDAVGLALAGDFPSLRAGDWVLLDGGDGRRDVVRLTAPARVEATAPPGRPQGPITFIRWSDTTPLSRDYCVTGLKVCGNLVPATHGESVNENLATWLPSRATRPRLGLAYGPLVHLDPRTPGVPAPAPDDDTRPPVARALGVTIDEITWAEVASLVGAAADATVYAVEVDDAGDATIVFPRGAFAGKQAAGVGVRLDYRVGGGSAGNVAAETLTVAEVPKKDGGFETPAWVASVTNPFPATGGRDRETRDHARRFAPDTFRTSLVAVTANDYRDAAREPTDDAGRPLLQRADAAFRWTGSWLTVTLAADPAGGDTLTPDARDRVLRFLDRRRLAGYDLRLTPARYVPLELVLGLCLRPGHLAEAVVAAVRRVLSPGPGGFFHPDEFTFGEPVSVSRLFAAAAAVPGVGAVHLVRLSRFKSPRADAETADALATGFLPVGPDEIVRLDADPNNPQNGTLEVLVRGVGP